MAKGSVRKKGKKWYYRFYVEDASGRQIQKEYAGTESKSETEKLLRQAMGKYESESFIADTKSITLAALLDIWAEEYLCNLLQNLIDRILSVDFGDTDMANLQYLFDTEAICEFDFFSRTSTPDGRMEYIINNLKKYFCLDDLKEYDSFEACVVYPAYAPITGEEASEIAGCIHSLIMKSHPGGEDTFRFRCHAGERTSDSFDVHVLLVASR